jgi:hypothetical protein
VVVDPGDHLGLGPNAEDEAASRHDLRGGRGLGDDRRMNPERRASYAGGDLLAGRGGDTSDDTPDECALSLAIDNLAREPFKVTEETPVIDISESTSAPRAVLSVSC